MLIFKKPVCLCNLHLYLQPAFHHILPLFLFQIQIFFPPKVLQLLAPLLHSYKSRLKHTQGVCVFVFLLLTKPSGSDLPIHIFTFQ